MSEIIRENDQIVIKPGRDVVASTANAFRAELQELTRSAPKKLVIDLSGVEMVDSVGIGVIIATHNSMEKNGGKLYVIHVEKEIYSLFKTIRLDQHFTIQCEDSSG